MAWGATQPKEGSQEGVKVFILVGWDSIEVSLCTRRETVKMLKALDVGPRETFEPGGIQAEAKRDDAIFEGRKSGPCEVR